LMGNIIAGTLDMSFCKDGELIVFAGLLKRNQLLGGHYSKKECVVKRRRRLSILGPGTI
jgi:hypothetical protein